MKKVNGKELMGKIKADEKDGGEDGQGMDQVPQIVKINSARYLG